MSSASGLTWKQPLLLKTENHEMAVEAKKHAYHACTYVATSFTERREASILAKEKALSWLSNLCKGYEMEDFSSEF